MRFKRTAQITAITVALTFGLTACSGSSRSNKPTGPNAIITADGCEPKVGLITTDTAENCGGRVIDLISEGLYTYDEKGNLVEAGISSWENPNNDNKNFTIKIKSGLTFDDGSPITAKNYVDAWNYGANAINAQGTSDFFQDIEGYDPNNNTQTKLSGLKVVDDHTFTVKLSHPVSDFKERMGINAFRPLPEQAFKDPKAFGEKPIGNGPYKIDPNKGWQHNTSISLVKNDKYNGPNKPKNGGIDFMVYQSPDAAYSDVQADNLDVLYQIPPSELKSYQLDFKGRNANVAYDGITVIGIPTYVKHFHQDKEGKLRRQALSLAIDRDKLMDKIFSGTEDSATQFAPGTLPGYDTNISGMENTKYNPVKAKELWKQADAISPFTGTLTLSYNNDGGHKQWVDAVTNLWKNNLGINAAGNPYPDFKSFLQDRDNKKLTGAFRSGWQADYPSIYNFLQPSFQTDADSNSSFYTNPTFDAKLQAALAAPTAQERNAQLNEAQSILLDDMAGIPLYDYKGQAVWSNNVKNVKLQWNGLPAYTQITATN
ncbi:MAG: ABC transporter substrate-binding protein [Micrococcaceae bacterium]